MNLDRLPIVQEGLHHLGEPPNLILHNYQLAHEFVAAARQLRTVARAQLVERQADEVERVLDLVGQRARQLPQRREALEPIKLLLPFARAPQLRHHVVEAPREQSDFVAAARLRHRLEPARGDILRGGGHRVNRLDVALGQDIREHQPHREDRQAEREQA